MLFVLVERGHVRLVPASWQHRRFKGPTTSHIYSDFPMTCCCSVVRSHRTEMPVAAQIKRPGMFKLINLIKTALIQKSVSHHTRPRAPQTVSGGTLFMRARNSLNRELCCARKTTRPTNTR